MKKSITIGIVVGVATTFLSAVAVLLQHLAGGGSLEPGKELGFTVGVMCGGFVLLIAAESGVDDEGGEK